MLRVVNRDAAGVSMECGGRAERRRRFGRSGATRLANRKPHAPSKAASALRFAQAHCALPPHANKPLRIFQPIQTRVR